MEDQRQTLGRRGEELAAAFLESKGFRLLAKNWRCRLGEIDLIVEREGEVRFVEVKTRLTTTYGHPEEAITSTKLLHLKRAIELWLHQVRSLPRCYQADAIAILVESGTAPKIEWIEGIL